MLDGYGGGNPSSTHLAILRCALGGIPDPGDVRALIGDHETSRAAAAGPEGRE
jgi:hypothetical protein